MTQGDLFDPPPDYSARFDKPKITMRDYQERAVSRVIEEWESVRSTLVVLPTGAGKTICFAEIIRRMQPARALVIAHREELIFQAKSKIEHVTGLRCEIEMAAFRAQGMSTPFGSMPDVIVSTVQTQCAGNNGGRMTSFEPKDFGLVIIDEAHHAPADSYRRVIDYYKQNPDIKILGVTATPDRADEEALGKVFETVAYDYEIIDAIRDGWLVPVDQQMIHVEGLDFSEIRTTAGDLNGGDLADLLEKEKHLHGIADPIVQLAKDRRTVIFAASVAQAEKLAEIINRQKPKSAAWLCGETPKDERRQLLSQFGNGEIQFIANVGVLTEGWDDVGVEICAMGRPTKSRALYAQMAGRVLRPLVGVVDGHEKDTPEQRKAAIGASNKKSALIVDFVGNAGRHKLMSTADILGGNMDDEVVEKAAKIARDAGTAVRMDKAFEIAEEEIRLAKEAKQRRLEQEQARRLQLIGKAKFSATTISPFDVLGITPQRSRGWDNGKELSDKQKGLLLKQGIDPSGMEFGAAKQLINEMFRRWNGKLSTMKQITTLARFGYDAKEWTMKESSDKIDAIAKNGWRRPE